MLQQASGAEGMDTHNGKESEAKQRASLDTIV